MTVTESIAEQAAGGDAQALFEEARRRRRRRWMLVGGFLVSAALVTVGVLSFSGGGGNGSRNHVVSGESHSAGLPVEQSTTGGRASTALILPTRYTFNSVTTSGSNPHLSGTVASTKQSPQCVVAPVNPQTLKLGKIVEGSCNSPVLWGATILPVTSYLPGSSGDRETVAITRLDARTKRVSTGPVIMTFAQSSDASPVFASGDGSLWVYDVATTNGPEVLQISEATGQVTATVSVPALSRPLLAVNDDGLWLGDSVQGGTSSSALWHVARGASSAVPVVGPPRTQRYVKAGVGLTTETLSVIWIVGSGHHLWAGIGPTYTQQTIWAFTGPSAQVEFHIPDHGFDPTVVVGDATAGLFSVGPYPPFGEQIASRPRSQDVIRIDPKDGKETLVSTLRPFPVSDQGVLLRGQLTYVDGSVFVLEPTFDAFAYPGFNELVRVKVSGNA